MQPAEIEAVRAFNRFYTGVIGVLGEGLVQTPYSLSEARVLFELGRSGSSEAAELRRELDLDGGYLSRMLAGFETAGLLVRERSQADARRQVVRLTGAGRSTCAMLAERASAEVAAMLDRLPAEQRPRLIGAMRTVQEILTDPPQPRSTVLREPRAGDYGWVVERHGALYAAEYGWDHTYEALVARIVAGYLDGHDPQTERGWIAEVDGARAGSIFCVRRDAATAQLRLLLVEPSARGLGVGSRLIEECLRFASEAGYAEIALWTVDCLHAARRLYERAGFTLTEQEPQHSWGTQVNSQVWRRAL